MKKERTRIDSLTSIMLSGLNGDLNLYNTPYDNQATELTYEPGLDYDLAALIKHYTYNLSEFRDYVKVRADEVIKIKPNLNEIGDYELTIYFNDGRMRIVILSGSYLKVLNMENGFVKSSKTLNNKVDSQLLLDNLFELNEVSLLRLYQSNELKNDNEGDYLDLNNIFVGLKLYVESKGKIDDNLYCRFNTAKNKEFVIKHKSLFLLNYLHTFEV